jgi:hypothetical protein
MITNCQSQSSHILCQQINLQWQFTVTCYCLPHPRMPQSWALFQCTICIRTVCTLGILTLQAIFTWLASFNALTKSGPIQDMQDVSISCSCLSVSMLQYSLHNRRQPYICIIVP